MVLQVYLKNNACPADVLEEIRKRFSHDEKIQPKESVIIINCGAVNDRAETRMRAENIPGVAFVQWTGI